MLGHEAVNGAILVVDDNEVKRFTTTAILTKAGFAVMEAVNGKDALWLATSQSPALIVLDVNLPDISGMEVARRLKARAATASIPLLHLSATRIEPSDRSAGLDSGADAYLTSASEPQELISTVHALLRARRSEAMAQTLSRQWQASFDAIGHSVCLLDEQGQILRCNKQMAELLQVDASAATGQRYAQLLHRNLELAGQPVASAPAPTDTATSYEIELRGRWFWATSYPIIDDLGVTSGTVEVVRDITDRRQQEVELKEAKRAAEAANTAKSSFLANMSHEIRTPLGAILGFGELLKTDDLSPEERREFLGTILRNGQELVHLIDDILDLSKVEAGRLDIEKIKIPLQPLLDDVTSSLGVKAREKALELRLTYASTVPSTILSDPTRLRQILINVIGNAIKFTERGYVEVQLRFKPAADAALASLEFTISDSGAGISLEAQSKLFQPFLQADSSTTRRFGGTGLGLVLSRNLARALGGELWLAQSLPGRGTSFVFTIDPGPVSATSLNREAEPKAPSEIKLSIQHALDGVRVLLAEDAPDNRVLIRRFLTASGASVDLAEHGAEAVRCALTSDYDLILMDMQMPVLDGYTATRELRKLGYAKPIIALTAHAMREEREKSLNAGCDDHLTKPITAKQLIQKIVEFTAKVPTS